MILKNYSTAASISRLAIFNTDGIIANYGALIPRNHCVASSALIQTNTLEYASRCLAAAFRPHEVMPRDLHLEQYPVPVVA